MRSTQGEGKPYNFHRTRGNTRSTQPNQPHHSHLKAAGRRRSAGWGISYEIYAPKRTNPFKIMWSREAGQSPQQSITEEDDVEMQVRKVMSSMSSKSRGRLAGELPSEAVGNSRREIGTGRL
ncbi:hypothetical protein ACLOJK_013317 [Asimina triloba]